MTKDYRKKTDVELMYIMQDANEAAKAMQNHSPIAEAKYLDQINDAATEVHHRLVKKQKKGK